MIRRYGKLIRFGVMAVDGGLATISSLLIYDWLARPDGPTGQFSASSWAGAVLFGILWVVLLYIQGAYRLRAHWTVTGEVIPVMRATFWLAAIGIVVLFVASVDVESSAWAFILFPIQGASAILLRAGLRLAFMYFRQHGYNVRNVVVLGTGPKATSFARLVHEHSVLGVKISGYLGDEPSTVDPEAHFFGAYEELPRVLREEVVDEIAVCVHQSEWPRIEELVQLAHEEGKLIRVPLTVPDLRSSERFLEDLDGVAVLSYSSGPNELVSHAAKRIFDLVIGTIGLIIAAPFMLAIAIALRTRQGPGVIFRQERVGLHGRSFTMYKFRTMVPDAEERFPELAHRSETNGPAFKLKDDPRVTPAGRWLRRYSLDEMPQFLNVIRGEMSVVGPRPAPLREVQEYDVWHRRRLSVKPGITGLWQINSRLDEDFDRRAKLDMVYIDRWSIWLDLAILFWTIPAVLRRPGH
jgi:exopolysaccharide biosynthesis polyprenyl glycosylphosphotransferase